LTIYGAGAFIPSHELRVSMQRVKDIVRAMKEITSQLLNEIVSRIVKAIVVEKIILFGSHAWGKQGESSDIDLFVIVPYSDEPYYRRAREIYKCLRGIGVPVDVIVRTHDEVERSKGVATSLTKAVLEKGKVLYG